MSDQLAAAAEVMGVPQPIVERSARAWASASGTTFEDILASWSGGEAVAGAAPSAPAPAPADEAPPEAPASEPEAAAPAPEPVAAAPAMPVVAAAAPLPVEPEEEVEPLALGDRVRLGGRIGAWAGVALGFFGFVMAGTWLLSAASLTGEEGAFGPAVEVTTSRLLIGVTLLSVVFGVIVAALSRFVAGWADRAAQLEGRWGATVGLGAALGLVLGAGAGAVMVSAFTTPVEGAEGVGLMSIVPAAIEVLIGGAFLGWVTAALVQVIGVPAALHEGTAEEIADVRGRLSATIRIPVVALGMLALLVLPLGYVFIRSNELAGGGAAVLAIFAAASILGIASIGTSRPTMRMGLGELAVAIGGIVTVVVIVVAVIYSRADLPEETATETTVAESDESAGEEPGDGAAEDAEPAATTTP